MATFSAKTDNVKHVQKISDVIDKIQAPSNGMDFGTAMQTLRDSIKDLGFDPKTGAKAIQDLASDQRLRLIVEFNTVRARAAGQHAQRQDKVSLDLWPAQEFYRAEDRKEIRDWPAKWAAAGGEFFNGKSDYKEGRMVALVNDPIWEQISEFGVPYAPFDFNSGMDVRPVSRAEAEDMGLISEGEEVIPEPMEFGDPETTMQVSPELEDQVLRDLGPGYGFVDNPEGGRILKQI